MPKANRGKSLWRIPARGRGTCPICLATRIKLLYTRTKSNDERINVCKRCSPATSNRVDQAMKGAGAMPYRRKHRRLLKHESR